MPAPSLNALVRQWEILKILPQRAPGLLTSDITQHFNNLGYMITRRTIERDLAKLSTLFPIFADDDATGPYRWHWISESSIGNLPGITLSDALTLHLVENSMRPLLPSSMLRTLESRFNQAKHCLQAIGDDSPAIRWMEKIATVPTELPLKSPEVNTETLNTLQFSLLQETQIQCTYNSATGKISSLRLNPLALIQRGKITYLAAISHGHTDVRLFAAHRFLKAEKLNDKCQRPKDFCLKKYISSGAMQFNNSSTPIKLKAWICNELARQLNETPLGDDMLIEQCKSGDGFLLSATQFDSWQLRWWLLMQSGRLVVHEPAELRTEIVSLLNKALAQYQSQPEKMMAI